MDEILPGADFALDIVTDALQAMDDGGSIYEVNCARLSRILRATAAAYVQIDVCHRIGTVRCWPSTVDALGLQRLTERTPATHPVLRYHLDGNAEPPCLSAQLADRGARVRSLRSSGVVGPAAIADVADLPLTCTPDQLCLVAFARDIDFTAAELDLLRRMHCPIVALDAHLQRLRAFRMPEPTFARGVGPDPVRLAAGDGVTPRVLKALMLLAEGLACDVDRRPAARVPAHGAQASGQPLQQARDARPAPHGAPGAVARARAGAGVAGAQPGPAEPGPAAPTPADLDGGHCAYGPSRSGVPTVGPRRPHRRPLCR